MQALPPGALSAIQEPQHGTGHAVGVALAALSGADTTLALILYGDMPLITAPTLRALLDTHTARWTSLEPAQRASWPIHTATGACCAMPRGV